jgi:hypothetical protein
MQKSYVRCNRRQHANHVLQTMIERMPCCLISLVVNRRSSSNEPESVRPLLDIRLFECHARSNDENIENVRIRTESKLSFLLR